MSNLQLVGTYIAKVCSSLLGIVGLLSAAVFLITFFVRSDRVWVMKVTKGARRFALPLGVALLFLAQFMTYRDLSLDYQAIQSNRPDVEAFRQRDHDLKVGDAVLAVHGRWEKALAVEGRLAQGIVTAVHGETVEVSAGGFARFKHGLGNSGILYLSQTEPGELQSYPAALL